MFCGSGVIYSWDEQIQKLIDRFYIGCQCDDGIYFVDTKTEMEKMISVFNKAAKRLEDTMSKMEFREE